MPPIGRFHREATGPQSIAASQSIPADAEIHRFQPGGAVPQTSSGFPRGIILSGIFLSGGGRSRRRRYRGTVTIVGVKVARVKRARNRGEKPEKEPGRELEGLNEDGDRGNGGKPSERGREGDGRIEDRNARGGQGTEGQKLVEKEKGLLYPRI